MRRVVPLALACATLAAVTPPAPALLAQARVAGRLLSITATDEMVERAIPVFEKAISETR